MFVFIQVVCLEQGLILLFFINVSIWKHFPFSISLNKRILLAFVFYFISIGGFFFFLNVSIWKHSENSQVY